MEEHKASFNGEKTVNYIPLESMDLFLWCGSDEDRAKRTELEFSRSSPKRPFEIGFMRMPITSLENRTYERKPYVIVIVSLGFGRDLSSLYIEFDHGPSHNGPGRTQPTH